MAIVNGEGIGYVEDVKTWSVYHVVTGGRPILEISVNNEDPELKIWVGRPNSRRADVENDIMSLTMLGAPIVTKGVATSGTHEVGGSDVSPGELKDHIDGISVYQYVLPRLIWLLADVYVPKPITDV